MSRPAVESELAAQVRPDGAVSSARRRPGSPSIRGDCARSAKCSRRAPAGGDAVEGGVRPSSCEHRLCWTAAGAAWRPCGSGGCWTPLQPPRTRQAVPQSGNVASTRLQFPTASSTRPLRPWRLSADAPSPSFEFSDTGLAHTPPPGNRQGSTRHARSRRHCSPGRRGGRLSRTWCPCAPWTPSR